jgi:hypothetical protein
VGEEKNRLLCGVAAGGGRSVRGARENRAGACVCDGVESAVSIETSGMGNGARTSEVRYERSTVATERSVAAGVRPLDAKPKVHSPWQQC